MNLQKSDMSRDENPVGYPDRFQNQLSKDQVDGQLLQEQGEGVQKFIAALQMKNPATREQGLQLLKNLVRDLASSRVDYVVGAMRMLNWDRLLTGGEDLTQMAQRALDFFNTHEGIEVVNGVSKIVSRIDDEMWTTDHNSPMQNGGG